MGTSSPEENADLTNIEDMPVSDLPFVSPELLMRLSEFHINSIGSLLGATAGLLEPIRVGDEFLDEAKIFSNQLEEFVPEDILNRYREPQGPFPYTGSLIPDIDKEEED